MKTIFALPLTLVSIVVTLLLTIAYGQLGGKVIRNRIGMEFVNVPAGTFMMGSIDVDAEAGYENYKRYFPNAKLEEFTAGEKPQHRVDIRKEFYIGRYEVTIGEWKAVMGDLPEGMKTNLADGFKMSDR